MAVLIEIGVHLDLEVYWYWLSAGNIGRETSLNTRASIHQSSHVTQFIFSVGINFRPEGSYQEFNFKEKGFFEISKNKFPSKITRYTVAINELTRVI